MKKILIGITSILIFTNMSEVSAKGFIDVDSERWSYSAINNISDKGLIEGYTNGSFQPTKIITRAEAASIINNYLVYEGKLLEEYTGNNFSDVPSNVWYETAVNNAAGKGIFSGDEKENFNPHNTLTRAEMVSIFNRLEGFEKKYDHPFSDVSASDWFAEDVKIGFSNGIINGIKQSDGSTIFHGKGEVTREQFVTVMNNLYNRNEISKVDAVLELVNVEREKMGIKPLILDNNVSKVAQLKAEDMANNGYFAHESPTYGSPFEMLNQYNIFFSIAGENIAMGQKTPEKVMVSWMNSPGHRANILDSRFENIGIGLYEKNGIINWVQQFVTY